MSAMEYTKLQTLVNFVMRHRGTMGPQLADDEFSNLMEIIVSCPRGVYFRVYRNLRDKKGYTEFSDYLSVEEVVQYLFEVVELQNWKVKGLDYDKGRLVSGDTNCDLVSIYTFEQVNTCCCPNSET